MKVSHLIFAYFCEDSQLGYKYSGSRCPKVFESLNTMRDHSEILTYFKSFRRGGFQWF